jgi:hypothetical protein
MEDIIMADHIVYFQNEQTEETGIYSCLVTSDNINDFLEHFSTAYPEIEEIYVSKFVPLKVNKKKKMIEVDTFFVPSANIGIKKS